MNAPRSGSSDHKLFFEQFEHYLRDVEFTMRRDTRGPTAFCSAAGYMRGGGGATYTHAIRHLSRRNHRCTLLVSTLVVLQ